MLENPDMFGGSLSDQIFWGVQSRFWGPAYVAGKLRVVTPPPPPPHPWVPGASMTEPLVASSRAFQATIIKELNKQMVFVGKLKR